MKARIYSLLCSALFLAVAAVAEEHKIVVELPGLLRDAQAQRWSADGFKPELDDATPLADDLVREMVLRMASNESKLKQVCNNYAFDYADRVQDFTTEIGPDGNEELGQFVGEYYREGYIVFNDRGVRLDYPSYAPVSTMRFDNVPSKVLSVFFLLTYEKIGEYNVEYLGAKKIVLENKSVDTYVLKVSPRQMRKNDIYFSGLIWVGKKTYQIMKSYGKEEPDQRSLAYEKLNYRYMIEHTEVSDPVDGETYWLPGRFIGQDILRFGPHTSVGGPVGMKIEGRYYNYRRFDSQVKILSAEDYPPNVPKTIEPQRGAEQKQAAPKPVVPDMTALSEKGIPVEEPLPLPPESALGPENGPAEEMAAIPDVPPPPGLTEKEKTKWQKRHRDYWNIGKGRKIARKPLFTSREKAIAAGARDSRKLQMNPNWKPFLQINRRISEYVNGICQDIARNSDVDATVTCYVYNTNGWPKSTGVRKYDAFIFRDGSLFVSSGLMLACPNEVVLRAVLAHEIAHFAAGHGAAIMSRKQVLAFSSIFIAQTVNTLRAFGAISGSLYRDIGYGQMGAVLTMQNYARGAELEADCFSVQYLYRGGWDPRGTAEYVRMMQKLIKDNHIGYGARGPFVVLYNHPSWGARLKKAESFASELPALAIPYKTDSPEFRAIKEDLEKLPIITFKKTTKAAKVWHVMRWGLRHVMGMPIP
ncbi:MAG: M48 family metalloprotease [bacterium]|nr:M48 family metalloprotease [bacterium]